MESLGAGSSFRVSRTVPGCSSQTMDVSRCSFCDEVRRLARAAIRSYSAPSGYLPLLVLMVTGPRRFPRRTLLRNKEEMAPTQIAANGSSFCLVLFLVSSGIRCTFPTSVLGL